MPSQEPTLPHETQPTAALPRRWQGSLLAFLLYGLLAVASYYPHSIRPSDSVSHIGDPLESAYLIAWNVHQVAHDPFHMFDANILFPLRHSLAFTDHRFLPSLMVAPVLWTTGNPILAYNVAVITALLLAAMAARHLAGLLGLEALGAWVVGALYGFHTYQINEAPRVNVIFHAFTVLALGQLIVLLVCGKRRAAWGASGFLVLQGFSSNYLLLYAVLLFAVVILGSAIARPRIVLPRLRLLILPAAVGGLLMLPVVIPYVLQTAEHGLRRELPQGIDLAHYIQTFPTNLLYGSTAPNLEPGRRPHFVGFVSLAVAAWALWTRKRRDTDPSSVIGARIWVPVAGALAAVFVALSLGRDVMVFGHYLAPGPYVLLYEYVPGFKLVRFPERLGLLVMLFIALLVGRGVSLLSRAKWRLLAVTLALLVPIEHLSPTARGEERIPVGADVPTVYRWLAHAEVRCLAEVPAHPETLVRLETLEMYFSTYHFKPMIHGYTAYPLPVTQALRQLALEFPAPESLEGLRRVGVDTLIAHLPSAAILAEWKTTPPRLRERFADQHQLEPFAFYKGIESLARSGRLIRIATFDQPPTRIPGGQDVVFRLD